MSTSVLLAAESVSIGEHQVPFLGQANVWIEDSVENRTSLGLTQLLIQQALEGTYPGQLEVTVFDDALSGLSAPFEAMNSGGEKLLLTVNDQREFSEQLTHLRDHIQGVNNRMQGQAANLAEFLRVVDYPIEGYKVIVVSTDVSLLDEAKQNQLGILLRAGPRAGVSFLVHSGSLGIEFLAGLCDRYAIKRGQFFRGDTAVGQAPELPSASTLIVTAKRVASVLASTAMTPIAFTDVQPATQLWTESSADGVTFAVGRCGMEIAEITLGDELNQRHNMLVTGAVGQGKSNLINVIIHSLCQRYSPSEVQLLLLDFKEGVTLQAFFSESTGEYLPHARVLGLEADREFGLSLFRYLFDVYKERMRLFKSAGVQSIRQYRAANPVAAMPRMIVIIDEFQMMFSEQDNISDLIADLLVKAVRLFRACGIHVILASQTIGGNLSLMGSAGEGLFGQVPVRVALKNSLAESHATLGVKNDAAVHLRSRQAIINLDYGEVSSNRKTSIARADETKDGLGSLRHDWWLRTHNVYPAPYVFIGERLRSLDADVPWLLNMAKTAWSTPWAVVGSRIQVDGEPMALPFGREVGRNIAVVGSGSGMAETVSIALSLALQLRRGQFVLLDFLEDDPAWNTHRDHLAQTLHSLGVSLTVVRKADVPGVVSDLAAALASPEGVSQDDTVVLGLGLERCRAMPPEFADLCRVGPALGTHVIGWWTKLDAFREHIGYGGETQFDIKIALRLDPQSVKQFVNDPLLEWKPIDNRALVWDSAELAEPIRIIPYSAMSDELAGREQ